MIVSLAPSRRAAAVRTLLLLAAALVIVAAMVVVDGAPSPRRRVRQNEIARFAPTVGHGLVQLIGETGLLVVAVFVARRGLRVRL